MLREKRGAALKRRAAVGVIATAAVVLAFASVAYACTVVGGQSYVDGYSSGVSKYPGDSMSVTGSGARPGWYYYTHFLNFKREQDSMATCMNGGGATHPGVYHSTGQYASSSGYLSARTRTVPTDIHPGDSTRDHATHPSNSTNGGPALVCHITPQYEYATKSASVTIL